MRASYADGLTAGAVSAGVVLALSLVFVSAWDVPEARKRPLRAGAGVVAGAILVWVPVLNAAYAALGPQ